MNAQRPNDYARRIVSTASGIPLGIVVAWGVQEWLMAEYAIVVPIYVHDALIGVAVGFCNCVDYNAERIWARFFAKEE